MREVGIAAILRGVDETAEHLGLSQKYVKDCVKTVMQGDPFFDAIQKMVWDSVRTTGESVTSRTFKLSLDTIRRFKVHMEEKEAKLGPPRDGNVEVTEWFICSNTSRSGPSRHEPSKRSKPSKTTNLASLPSNEQMAPRQPTLLRSMEVIDAPTRTAMIADIKRTGNFVEVAAKYSVDTQQLRNLAIQYYKTGKISDLPPTISLKTDIDEADSEAS